MAKRKTVDDIKAQLEDLDRKARQKKAALKEKIRRLEAAEKRSERKRDTRRKILLGALALDLMERDEDFRKAQLEKLDGYLTRPNDRALFGLDSEPAPKKSSRKKHDPDNEDTVIG